MFLHISIGWAFVVWGVDVALPWSVWRIGLGAYLLYWVGARYMVTIGLEGVYVLSGVKLDKGDEG